MMRKDCPRCGCNSYSANDSGTWICPHCGEDLAREPAMPAGAGENPKP